MSGNSDFLAVLGQIPKTFGNMDKMEKKYSKTGLLELSEENLTFEEIVTIYTFIERADHHGGEGSLFDEYSQNGTFSNLRKRLDEMRGGN